MIGIKRKIIHLTAAPLAAILLAALALGALGALGAPGVAAGQPAEQTEAPSAQELFDQASGAFERGLAASEAGETADAEQHFTAAAGLYERIVAEHGIDNAALRTSAGNAWLLAGQPGEAILAYRRALRLNPSHAGARAGLVEARESIGVEVPARASVRGEDSVVGIIGALGPGRLLWGGATLWALGWAGIGVGLARRLRAMWQAGVGTAVCGVLLIGAVGAAAWMHGRSAGGVILAEHVEARRGPSAAAYEPAFDAPLVAGVEVQVLEERGGWARVELLDGREAWVPGEAVGRMKDEG